MLSLLGQLFLLAPVLLSDGLVTEQKRVSRDKSVTRLNEWPMIYAHDAGTGMMETGLDESIFVNAAAMTQVGSLVDLAKCGARAFDIRPYLLEDGTLITHHGGYVCQEKLESELKKLMAWNKKHPEEFVLIGYSHCTGDEGNSNMCYSAFDDLVDKLDLKVASKANLLENVVEVDEVGIETSSTMTITVARAQELAGGVGIPLVFSNNDFANNWSWDEGWCYKFTELDKFVDFPQLLADTDEVGNDPNSDPYEGSLDKLKEIGDVILDAIGSVEVGVSCYFQPGLSMQREEQKRKWDEMVTNPEQWVAAGKPLWKADGHWQYSTEAITLMFMHASSILYDSLRSNQNEFIAQVIRNGGAKEGLNLVGLDHVCEGGPQVKDAIDDTLFEEQDVFEWADNYFDNYIDGVQAGELKYTVPSGFVALLSVSCFCFCLKKRCDAQSKMMNDEWDDEGAWEKEVQMKEWNQKNGKKAGNFV